MKLTAPERLILWNLFEIRKQLEGSDADYWGKMAEILREGYEILYSDLPHLDDEMPEERGRIVFDVLDLYRTLDHYIRENPDDSEVADHSWATFAGFDGNNEGDLMGLCRYLIHKQGKWQEQLPNVEKTDDFNSHMANASRYASMIGEWRRRDKPYPLSADDARAILDPSPPASTRLHDEDDGPRRGDKFRI